MESSLHDLRFIIRLLLRHPGFAAIAVLTLAFGIGANTAIFSIVYGVLLRPLPYPDPGRLVRLYGNSPQRNVDFGAVSPQDFDDWRAQSRSFAQMADYFSYEINVTGGGEPEAVTGTYVSPGFFETFGRNASHGRTLLTEENKPGADRVAVLSDGFWKRRFGSSPSVLGQMITLDNRQFTVVGIMPAGFDYLSPKTSLWLPLSLIGDDAVPHRRGVRWLNVVARLAPAATLAQAQSEMSTIAARLAAQYPETNAEWGRSIVAPLEDRIVGEVRPALFVLLAAVGFVLLIGCANVANLLLARAESRRREIAVRTAIGASRARILRQLLTENILLSVLGGALGLLTAFGSIGALVRLFADHLPRYGDIRLDAGTLAFTFLISLAAGLIFGVAPALKMTGADLQTGLKEGGRGQESGGRGPLRSALVVAEVALAAVLVIGAGLMLKSFWLLVQVDPGFNPENALTVSYRIPTNKYQGIPQMNGYYRRVLKQVETLPGVISAGCIKTLPLQGEGESYDFVVEGRSGSPSGETARTQTFPVSENYFGAMGIPLLSGRTFAEHDLENSPAAAIINQVMARRYWPRESPLGQMLRAGRAQLQIVGIVGDVRQAGLDKEPSPTLYVPHTRFPRSAVTIVVRSHEDPIKMASLVRGAIWTVDRDQPIIEIATMQQVLAGSTARPRLFSFLLGAFAALALFLAALGIYGVLSYSVSRRTHEIGVRMALGARRDNILLLVVGQGMALTCAGLAIGLAAAAALTRLISRLLYGVGVMDPQVFAGVAVGLALVALFACYVPARRATRVDPMEALRYE